MRSPLNRDASLFIGTRQRGARGAGSRQRDRRIDPADADRAVCRLTLAFSRRICAARRLFNSIASICAIAPPVKCTASPFVAAPFDIPRAGLNKKKFILFIYFFFSR